MACIKIHNNDLDKLQEYIPGRSVSLESMQSILNTYNFLHGKPDEELDIFSQEVKEYISSLFNPEIPTTVSETIKPLRQEFDRMVAEEGVVMAGNTYIRLLSNKSTTGITLDQLGVITYIDSDGKNQFIVKPVDYISKEENEEYTPESFKKGIKSKLDSLFASMIAYSQRSSVKDAFRASAEETVQDSTGSTEVQYTTINGVRYAITRPSNVSGKIYHNNNEKTKAASLQIGNAIDAVVRAYFQGERNILSSVLPQSHVNAIIKSLNEYKTTLDAEFGEGNYTAISSNIPLAIYSERYLGTNNVATEKVKALVRGSFDLIIYGQDKKGNGVVKIIDIKTTNNLNFRIGDTYIQQLEAYSHILRTILPGIENIATIQRQILPFRVHFEETGLGVEADGYIYDRDNDRLIRKADGKNYKDITEYNAPEYLGIQEVRSPGETQLLLKDGKIIVAPKSSNSAKTDNPYKGASTLSNQVQTDRSINSIVPASEVSFIAREIMINLSNILDRIIADEEYAYELFPHIVEKYNLSELERKQVLKLVSASALFEIAKEEVIGVDSIADFLIELEENGEETLDNHTLYKLEYLRNNPQLLIDAGYKKLIELEGWSLLMNNLGETQDIGQSIDLDAEIEQLMEEEADVPALERWQYAEKSMSAKSSLSAEIRRTLEKLPMLDHSGNPILDRFGYQIPTHIDSTKAMNTLLHWLSDFRSIEDMEAFLKEKSEFYPWVNLILESLKEPSFRSKFFRNFRKQQTIYSTVIKKEGPDGRIVYRNLILNHKNAAQQMKFGIKKAFLEGKHKLVKGDPKGKDGIGSINIENLNKLNDILDDLRSILKNPNNADVSYVSKQVENLLKILDLPIEVGAARVMVQEALLKGNKPFDQSDLKFILDKASVISNNLGESIGEGRGDSYSPMMIASIDSFLSDGNSTKSKDYTILSPIEQIAATYGVYMEEEVESGVYHNGKSYYTFNTPSFAYDIFNELGDSTISDKEYTENLDKKFGRFQWFAQKTETGTYYWNAWLRRLSSSKKARANLTFKTQLDFLGTTYAELEAIPYLSSLLFEFYHNTVDTNTAYYAIPVLSNKHLQNLSEDMSIKMKIWTLNITQRDILNYSEICQI